MSILQISHTSKFFINSPLVNSYEYQMAGGTRKSDVYDGLCLRKRTVRQGVVLTTS
ncbi:hypothetical protein [Nostoc sp.]|uniref:hypothetical protein n=1 Tax=Nostoc sp. TaxID=1180 RepID=UPI002FFCAF79